MIRADLARVVHESTGGAQVGALRHWLHLVVPSGFAPVLFRVAHLAHAGGWRRLAAMTTLLNQRLCGAFIHPASRIGGGLFIPHTAGVTFCGSAGVELSLYPACHVSARRFAGLMGGLHDGHPRLGDRVRVGTLAVVIGGVTIGDDALVGVQVVMAKDLPAGSVVHVRPGWRVVRPVSGDGGRGDETDIPDDGGML